MAAPHPALLSLLCGAKGAAGITITGDVVASAEEHDVAPLLSAAQEATHATAEPEALIRLTMRRLETAAQVAAADHTLERLLDVCEDVGVGICVFKGQSVGQLWYPHPDLRPTTDIDVFTDPRNTNGIVRLLAALDPDAARGALASVSTSHRFDHSVALGGSLVDIHTDPFKFPVAPRHANEAWSHTVRITTHAGRTVRALDLEMSTIIALVHGLRDNFADLLHLYDLALLFDAEPDWPHIEVYTAREGWTSLLRFAVAFVSDVLDRTPPIDTHIPKPTKTLMDRIWPRRILLQGGDSVAASLRRQALTGIFIEGRRREVATAFRSQLLPPRAVIESAGDHKDAAYPMALLRWRRAQRKRVRAIRDESTS